MQIFDPKNVKIGPQAAELGQKGKKYIGKGRKMMFFFHFDLL